MTGDPNRSPGPVRPVSTTAKFELFHSQWTPHRIAQFDGHQVLLARVEGEFVWHQHDDHDEVFLVFDGELLIDIEGQDTARLGAGDLLVVPKGVRHRPRTESGECRILVLDPMHVKHTGDVESSMTVDDYPEI